MILQSLYELYNRLSQDPNYNIAPPGYSLQKIVFRVVLKPDGSLHAIEDARSKDSRGRPIPRQILVPGQAKRSGSALNPCLLWDTSAYLLGYKSKDDKPERTVKTFEAFRKKHLELEPRIKCEAFSAVCRFLKGWDPKMALRWPVLDEVGNGYGVFQIIGETRFVHQCPEVQAFWAAQNSASEEKESGQCLITGSYGKIARLHYKIKRIGQGDSQLVSFNDDAYESYGKSQSYNAPVSEDAAFRYATALNALTDGPRREKHRFPLGDATVVFWTAQPTNTEDVFAQFALGKLADEESSPPQDEAIREKLKIFLKALRNGRQAYAELDADADRTPFFLLGLTAQSKGRIGVRFFYRNVLSVLLDNLRKHYADIALVRQPAAGARRPDPEFPALWQILDETCPRRNGEADRERIPPFLEGPLLRAVITGVSYPGGLYSAVMRRIHADRELNYIRACVIAGYLRRNLKKEVSMSLDKERKDPAYRLGRLFAALEKTQVDALRKTNTTIRERFYSSASATPAAVFPRLLRTYQHHLAKLEGGLKVVRERLVQEILEPLNELPTHLGLADQGLFALGYYHQLKDLWTSKEEKELEKGE